MFSHVGWLFFKSNYPKLYLIEREDLEKDPGSFNQYFDDPLRVAVFVGHLTTTSLLVVRWQHRYFGESGHGCIKPTLSLA